MTINDTALNKKINLFILLAGIALIFVFYPKKQLIWDEPFSIMCSKGFSHFNFDKFIPLTAVTSADLNRENTFSNVFTGGDSIYYLGLHFYSSMFNNTLNSYVSFSVIWGILSLIAFYFLARRLIGDNLFTSLAIFLFFTDMLFLNQTYSIRNYGISMFLVIWAGIYFFKYLYQENSFRNMFWLGTLCALSFLSHYFTCYIIAVFILVILYKEKLGFFTKKNILALVFPVVILSINFLMHRSALEGYKYYQNYIAHGQKVNMHISISETISLCLKSVTINFKIIYPLFRDTLTVRLCSTLIVIALFLYGFSKLPSGTKEKEHFTLLFILGIISSIFIAPLAYISGHAMLFSFRYFLFGMPFCSLFIALFIKTVFEYKKLNVALKPIILLVLLVPGIFEFIKSHENKNALPCNHVQVAEEIIKKNVHKVEVPEIADAIFLHCFMPANYEMSYQVNTSSNDVILYEDGRTEKIYLIKNGLVAIY